MTPHTLAALIQRLDAVTAELQTLHAAVAAALAAGGAERTSADPARDEALEQKILHELATDGPLSGNKLARRLHRRRAAVQGALRALEASGGILHARGAGWTPGNGGKHLRRDAAHCGATGQASLARPNGVTADRRPSTATDETHSTDEPKKQPAAQPAKDDRAATGHDATRAESPHRAKDARENSNGGGSAAANSDSENRAQDLAAPGSRPREQAALVPAEEDRRHATTSPYDPWGEFA